MITDKDRRHADLMAAFLSQLAVAFVAAAFLQALIPDLAYPGRIATTLMTGFVLLGVAHIVVERSHGERT